MQLSREHLFASNKRFREKNIIKSNSLHRIRVGIKTIEKGARSPSKTAMWFRRNPRFALHSQRSNSGCRIRFKGRLTFSGEKRSAKTSGLTASTSRTEELPSLIEHCLSVAPDHMARRRPRCTYVGSRIFSGENPDRGDGRVRHFLRRKRLARPMPPALHNASLLTDQKVS